MGVEWSVFASANIGTAGENVRELEALRQASILISCMHDYIVRQGRSGNMHTQQQTRPSAFMLNNGMSTLKAFTSMHLSFAYRATQADSCKPSMPQEISWIQHCLQQYNLCMHACNERVHEREGSVGTKCDARIS